MKLLLELRNKLKAKKPTFIRHDAHKKKRVGTGWRRPKGRQNKMRLHKKGYARDCSTGFGSPKAVYGLSREGLNQCIVNNVSDLASLDKKVDGVIVARTVGNRKRSAILEEATKLNLTILNIKVENFNKKLEEKSALRSAKKKVFEKKQKAKSATKKADSKAKKDSKSSSDSNESSSDKKSEEKKEKDKILTKKGGEQ